MIASALLMIAAAPSLASEGLRFMEKVDSLFWDARQSLYVEDAFQGKPSTQPAFNWSVGVALTALNSAAERDAKWKPRLREYVDKAETYWNDAPPVGGYDVLPGPKPMDRYYDDNAWMVLALLESAAVLKDPKLIQRASKTLDYVLSGEDGKLGGGIYWKEAEKTGKNACINAPAAVACLALNQVAPRPSLPAKAKELYAWTKKNLQDPSDGLIWDNMNLSGRVDKTKWTYNSALMLKATLGLAKVFPSEPYLADAKQIAEASVKRWIDPVSGQIACEGRFAHMLLEALLDYEKQTKTKVFDRKLTAKAILDLKGDAWLGKRWDWKGSGDRVELIDQVSGIRALLRLEAK